MTIRKPWTHDELLVAFRLYCRTPFGKLHRLNPDIIRLAQLMDRTPSSVGIAVPELLNASHIIPWSKDIARRADPCNGIALNALYDRAFDRGLITFDESFRLVLSERLKARKKDQEFPTLLQQAFLALQGQPLHLPKRFKPGREAMEYHREKVFR